MSSFLGSCMRRLRADDRHAGDDPDALTPKIRKGGRLHLDRFLAPGARKNQY